MNRSCNSLLSFLISNFLKHVISSSNCHFILALPPSLMKKTRSVLSAQAAYMIFSFLISIATTFSVQLILSNYGSLSPLILFKSIQRINPLLVPIATKSLICEIVEQVIKSPRFDSAIANNFLNLSLSGFTSMLSCCYIESIVGFVYESGFVADSRLSIFIFIISF